MVSVSFQFQNALHMIMQAASQGSVTQEHQSGKVNYKVYKMKLTITFPFWKKYILRRWFYHWYDMESATSHIAITYLYAKVTEDGFFMLQISRIWSIFSKTLNILSWKEPDRDSWNIKQCRFQMVLKHRGWDKMGTILQTTFWTAFSLMKILSSSSFTDSKGFSEQ